MRRLVISLFLTVLILPLTAQETAPAPKKRIVLAPVTSLTENKDFLYLKATIYNVLLIHLKKQERIAVLNEEGEGAREIIDAGGDTETYLASLARAFPAAVAIRGEYYVSAEHCHILVNVWDLDTLRVKNTFVETIPADLDLLPNIEKLSARIAVSVARELPPTERDALFQKQVVASKRKKINDEERLTTDIFAFRHALAVSPLTGLGTGRSVVSWTAGPLISPVLSLEYSYFFEGQFHLRLRAEYLGVTNLYGADGVQRELSLEALVGLHTLSSFSFALDAGLAVSIDWNTRSHALASTMPVDPTTRDIQRVSLTIPVAFGFSLSFTPRFFINLCLTYNGLTYTFEPLPAAAYDSGYTHFRYANGFSPWNFINFSILLKAGVRF